VYSANLLQEREYLFPILIRGVLLEAALVVLAGLIRV
jgi:hypothetical protein